MDSSLKTATQAGCALLGDARVLAFLRHLGGPAGQGILACQLVNEALVEGERLEQIFDSGGAGGPAAWCGSGYFLEVTPIPGDGFHIAFGCHAGPGAGDGGEWEVKFSVDGTVRTDGPVGHWMS